MEISFYRTPFSKLISIKMTLHVGMPVEPKQDTKRYSAKYKMDSLKQQEAPPCWYNQEVR